MEERETQASISEWADQTFGPAGSLLRVATRANEELAELLKAVAMEAPAEKLAEEAADVAIVLSRLAQRCQTDVPRQVSRLNLLRVDAPQSLVHASLNMHRLLSATLQRSNPSLGVDIALVVGYLGQFVEQSGAGSLDDAIQKKMARNRKRVWRLDGSGHGYHISEGEATR